MRISPKNIFIFFLWIFCTAFLFEDILMRIFPSIIEPQLQSYFAIDATQLGILSSGFMLSYAIMQIPAGILIDRFGLKRTLPFGTLVICLALFVLPLTHSYLLALITRFFMGLGSAFAFLGCMQVIFRFFALRKRPMMVGLTVMVAALAGVFCNTVLLWIAQHNWHDMINVLSLSAAVLTMALWWLLKYVPEPTTANEAPSVMKDLKVVGRNIQTWHIALLCGFIYLPYAMFNDMWGIPFLQVVDHISQTHASWVISSVWIGWMIGGPLLGWLSVLQKSLIKPIEWMILLQVVVLGVLLVLHHLPLFVLLITGGLLGVGAAGMNLCYLLGQQANCKQGVSLSVGIINTMVTICVLVFLPVMGLVLNAGVSSSAHNILALPAHNYIIAFSALFVVLSAGLLLSYSFNRQHHSVTVLAPLPA